MNVINIFKCDLYFDEDNIFLTFYDICAENPVFLMFKSYLLDNNIETMSYLNPLNMKYNQFKVLFLNRKQCVDFFNYFLVRYAGRFSYEIRKILLPALKECYSSYPSDFKETYFYAQNPFDPERKTLKDLEEENG